MGEQKPSIGRIVVYRIPEYRKAELENNGADACPAVIVRVWSDTCVNLRLLLDGDATPHVTSAVKISGPDDAVGTWDWPARV